MTTPKKRISYDMPDLAPLPPGQRRAVHALIGNGTDRTYPEAAGIAGMVEGTLLTHINRVRQRLLSSATTTTQGSGSDLPPSLYHSLC